VSAVTPPADPPAPATEGADPAGHPAAREAVALLDALVTAEGGEPRAGQRTMAAAVAEALARRRHLVVEAPTGTGKTFALAVAGVAWLAERRRAPAGVDDEDDDGADRLVVTTATKALQDQLVEEDLPRVAAVAEAEGLPFTWAVVKGRSNYLCLARTAEAAGSILEGDVATAARLEDAAEAAGTGDRPALGEDDDEVWRRFSVGADECPGARTCSVGARCWAEKARQAAVAADVVVVNTALYAAHLLAEGGVLPSHGAVVVDEAHALPDVLVSAASATIAPGRLRTIERLTRSWGAPADGRVLLDAARELTAALEGLDGVVDPGQGDLAVHLAAARRAVQSLARAASDRKGGGGTSGDGDDDAARAAAAATNLAADLAVALEGDTLDRVTWVAGGALHTAPVDAGELGARLLWPGRTVVCTSGTLQAADAAGRPTFTPFLAAAGAPGDVDRLAVPSPFDFARQAILYVPKGRIPSPKEPGWQEGVTDELWQLATAAGGRTLALFTSRRATEAVAEELRRRSEAEGAGIEVLTQWDGARERLVGALRRRRRVVLCATRGFWTGIDIPGDACVVVAIDRLPFARPDDPLAQARRRRAEERGANAFVAVDLPAAGAQLAQGVGRLIRSPEDRGVVAVLDTRLATAGWRRQVLGALPPLRRSVDLDEVRAFLAES
jgi:ATP-dependent DNA helicase DinG